jgi:hypothetical protein
MLMSLLRKLFGRLDVFSAVNSKGNLEYETQGDHSFSNQYANFLIWAIVGDLG